MRKKNSYSRIIQDLQPWQQLQKGVRIQLFHHCIEKKITSFYLDLAKVDEFSKHLGNALSESGLNRDKIQLIGRLKKGKNSEDEIIESVESLLLMLRTDYLDLLFLDQQEASPETVLALNLLKSRGQLIETGSINNKTSGKYTISANLWEIEPQTSKSDLAGPGELTSEDISQFLLVKEPYLQDELRLLAEKYDLNPKTLIYSWLLNHPAQFHLLEKGRNRQEIDLPVEALNTQLIKEDSEKISEIISIKISND